MLRFGKLPLGFAASHQVSERGSFGSLFLHGMAQLVMACSGRKVLTRHSSGRLRRRLIPALGIMDTSTHAQKLALAGAPVLAELHASGFLDLEKQLAESIELASSGSEAQRVAALVQIKGLCHVKALGDTWVKRPSDIEWLNMLSALRAAAAEASQSLTPQGRGIDA